MKSKTKPLELRFQYCFSNFIKHFFVSCWVYRPIPNHSFEICIYVLNAIKVKNNSQLRYKVKYWQRFEHLVKNRSSMNLKSDRLVVYDLVIWDGWTHRWWYQTIWVGEAQTVLDRIVWSSGKRVICGWKTRVIATNIFYIRAQIGWAVELVDRRDASSGIG